MAKTLKDFLEGYLKVKSADEQKFIDKHVTAKNPDRNGNGDDVFKGSTKPIDRRKERKGYNPGEDEKVYEELKGNQHKIDANHNGKVDAHDFKLLRKKKKVAEEAEQIDELDTATLKSYRTKARAQGNAIIDKMKMGGGDWSKDQKDTKTLRKRAAGANMSGKQLVKRGESLKTEEVEELDELSKATLGSYAHKAKDQLSKAEYRAGVKMGTRHMGAKPDAQERAYNVRANKRHAGLTMAIDKLAKEEVENIEEAGYSAKAARAGKDIGKPGKQFSKIASAAAKKYGSAERGQKVAGAVLAKLRKEEKLANKIADLSESHQRTIMNVFEKLNEDNKTKFLEACDTPDGVEKMLDFAINNRGE